jgi:hypothetical protein
MGQISTPNEVSVSYPRISYRFLLTVQKDLLSKRRQKQVDRRGHRGQGRRKGRAKGRIKEKRGGN